MTRGPVLGLVCTLVLGFHLAGRLASAQGAPASFVLTWTHTQDSTNPATGFAVQRCVQPATATPVAGSGESDCPMVDLDGATTIPYATPTYTDSTVQANRTYCYQVAAVNQFGRSPYSTRFCGWIEGGPPQNAPTGLQLRIVPVTP